MAATCQFLRQIPDTLPDRATLRHTLIGIIELRMPELFQLALVGYLARVGHATLTEFSALG